MYRTSLCRRLPKSFVFCLLVTSYFYGQTSKGNILGASPSSTASCLGLTFSHETWNSQISAPPGAKHDRILCCSLVMTKSTSLPFTLQPTSAITYSTGESVKYSPVDNDPPLVIDSLLVVAIDARRTDTSAIKLLNG
jgi:hypothetical protein